VRLDSRDAGERRSLTINRSIFLCDFCTNLNFRREILRVLNYARRFTRCSVHCIQGPLDHHEADSTKSSLPFRIP